MYLRITSHCCSKMQRSSAHVVLKVTAGTLCQQEVHSPNIIAASSHVQWSVPRIISRREILNYVWHCKKILGVNKVHTKKNQIEFHLQYANLFQWSQN